MALRYGLAVTNTSIELDSHSLLFVDEDIVAVDKQAGVLSDATRDPNRDHLGKALERWASHNSPTTENNSFFPAHRLDRGTSGVVLFARNKAAATTLMQQFQNRSISKHYHAVVHLHLHRTRTWAVGDTFEHRSYLRHHKGRSQEVRSGGKPSESSFEVMAVDGPHSLVRASPKTGRTHQLRVHLASLGTPIVGDDLYGMADSDTHNPSQRLWLHACELGFNHPTTQERLTIMSQRFLGLTDGSPVELLQ